MFAALRFQRLPNVRNMASSQTDSLVRRARSGVIYQRLDSSRDEIRLIRLTPASLTEPIQCSLFITPRDSAPAYKALSYAWGDRPAPNPIFIDSRPFYVTRNLKNGLTRIRPQVGEQELILWIDAICINQDDIPERSLQTAKMSSIYRNASSVLVLLGMENHGSSAALRFARDLLSSNKAKVATLLRGEAGENNLRRLVTLFRRRYFWRIWVIQEIHYAKSAVVYCGDDEISWNALDSVCDILAAQESNLRALLYKWPSWVHTLLQGGPRGLRLSRYSRPQSSFPPLLELLISHKSKESTDPKDKVFALVGISASRETFGNIDYSLSVREIYTHTARHIISTSKKLDVICVKSHYYNNHDLPSWAPDWTRPPHRPGGKFIDAFFGLQHCDTKFAAAGTTEACVEFLELGYVLKAKGVVISRITKVAEPFRQSKPPLHTALGLEGFQSWWTFFTQVKGSSNSARQEFARTISCGNWSLHECGSKLSALLCLLETNLMDKSSSSEGSGSGEEESTKAGMEALVSASLVMNGRRLFISENGTVGLAPLDSREEDIICVLLGCRFPVVLRREGERYLLVGEAYVEGIMHGEALVDAEEGGSQTFQIH